LKTTGRTNEGNFIVEMSEYEHNVLSYLAQAIEGVGVEFMTRPPLGMQAELSTALGAVIAFAHTKRMVNDLTKHLKDIDQELMTPDEDEHEKMMRFFQK
jgi:hypothetical protein